MCRCRWNRRLSTGHRLRMDWKHMGWRVGTFYLENKTSVFSELTGNGGYKIKCVIKFDLHT